MLPARRRQSSQRQRSALEPCPVRAGGAAAAAAWPPQPAALPPASDRLGRDGRPGRSRSCAPALLLQPPALFAFAPGLILTGPARTKCLQSRQAISDPARTHHGSGWLGGYLCSRHSADETGPQAGIGHPGAGCRLGKAVPTRHLHFASLLVASERAYIPVMGPVDELPIGQPLQILAEQTVLGHTRPAHPCLGDT